MRKMVTDGKRPGILIYQNGQVKAWCAIAPRSDFTGLLRPCIFAPVDDQPVWSIVCFFIDKNSRDQRLKLKTIFAAVLYDRDNEAEIIEAYPLDAQKK